jgi:hypothetical protein
VFFAKIKLKFHYGVNPLPVLGLVLVYVLPREFPYSRSITAMIKENPAVVLEVER